MNQEIIVASANYWAESRDTTEELLKLAQETKDDVFRQTLKIAVNIRNDVYGKQLTLEF